MTMYGAVRPPRQAVRRIAAPLWFGFDLAAGLIDARLLARNVEQLGPPQESRGGPFSGLGLVMAGGKNRRPTLSGSQASQTPAAHGT
jgi:hypothetical protein